MTLSQRLATATVLALAACGRNAEAQAERIAWGVEAWRCGVQTFDVQLGNGGDVWLRSLDGDASAASAPSSDPAKRWVRATLVSILPAGNDGAVAGRTLATPSVAANHSVAAHVLNLVLKQRGDQSVNLPVHLALDPPVRLPGGRLRAVLDTQTYTGDAARDARVGLDHPEECLDVELQLTAGFDRAAQLTARPAR